MAAPLQNMLRSAVQSVQWTYSLFWQICPQQRMLVWGDGYYNGAIKTRKTIHSMEVTAEEASLERSQQLRELYDSLAIGDTDQPARRPCAALSPEDLTESEWFYLICVSFSFPLSSGLPGKAYAKRKHVWLSGANESDSKTFTRAILAKSARIQTVVCIPMLDGVIEFGTTERVEEDLSFIQRVKTFFSPHSPKQALSEHSTTMPILHQVNEDDAKSDSKAVAPQNSAATAVGEPSELMQLEMSEDIRLGSPEDASNNLDSDFHMVTETNCAQPLFSGGPKLDELSEEETYYTYTVSTILQSHPSTWAHSASTGDIPYSVQSAFTKWTIPSNHHLHVPPAATSQWLLKHILFSVPKSLRDGVNDASARFRKLTAEDDHVLAERRRREKLNERFTILRSFVPFVTKMDKASILGDAIGYVKLLRKKINDLETRNLSLSRSSEPQRSESTGLTVLDQTRVTSPGSQKRKLRVVEGSSVEVSIIESDALVEVQCAYREGLLMDMMVKLRELGVEITTVQSSLNSKVFRVEMRAKVRENGDGKKASIVEVKRAIQETVPLTLAE